MDILTNKQRRQYSIVSRYSPCYFYYNTVDEKYIFGTTTNLDDTTEYTLYNLKQGDTLESLALKFYGRPDYYWIIADYNRILDPFIDITKKYKTLNIPSLSSIKFLSNN